MCKHGWHKVPREFYEREPQPVARDLLGKLLIRRLADECLTGRIVEAEAYGGSDDPASHAFRGPTNRNGAMFGPAGHAYVYRIYGLHDCLNAVTGEEGSGSAILLRGLEPLCGIDTMQKLRGVDRPHLLCSGPARLCQALAITRAQDGADLYGDELFIADDGYLPSEIQTSSRVGITAARERPWRYTIVGSPFVSRRVG